MDRECGECGGRLAGGRCRRCGRAAFNFFLGCAALAAVLALLTFTAAWPARAQTSFVADGKINVKSYIVAANTTAIVVKATSGTVYQVDAYNNGVAVAYIKLYNAATATCGSGTPQARYMIPFGAASSGGGFVTPNINGDVYVNGITMCVTTGIADNDTGAPGASTYIVNVHYK